MNRFANSLKWDMQLQFRYGFYYVAAALTFLWILILPQLPADIMEYFIPIFLLSNINIGTFFFIGAIILFEKSERTLDAVVVSPLRFQEFIAAKVLSLTLLSLLENGILVAVGLYKVQINYVILALSIMAFSVIYVLMGFYLVVGHQSISDYLLPAIGMYITLAIPMLQYLGLTQVGFQLLYFVSPFNPAIMLARGIAGSLTLWQWLYGVVGTVMWTTIAYYLAYKGYNKHIIGRLSL